MEIWSKKYNKPVTRSWALRLCCLILVFFSGCISYVQAKPSLDQQIQGDLQDKAQFVKLLEDTISKLSESKNTNPSKINFLKIFYSFLKQANSEQELYNLVSKYSVKRKTGDVLYTGYYKPLFRGSLIKTAQYSAPLYSFPKSTATRKELYNSGILASYELIYLKDPFDAYLAEIQGSVGILLESGEIVHLAFAGSNNHKYNSIGTELVKDNKLTKDGATIPGIRNFFKSNPNLIREYLNRNPRQVFFKKSPGEARGSSGVDLLKERAVATDRTIYPPGTVLFVKVEIPKKLGSDRWGTQVFSKFMLSLDSGSAIKGARRVDLYLGEGEEVGEVAGRLNSRGELEMFNDHS